MNHALVARDGHRNAGGAQLLAIRLAFIAQRIEFSGNDQRGRQALEAFRQRRRDARIFAVGSSPQVVLPEIDDVVLGQKVVGKIFVRVGIELGLGRGIDEELERDLRAARVARELLNYR